jgi:hypothetical protein
MPDAGGYHMRCSDCGLVHRLDFTMTENECFHLRVYRDDEKTFTARRDAALAGRALRRPNKLEPEARTPRQIVSGQSPCSHQGRASCSLYRHFDAARALLYVGIALDPIYRLSAHQSYEADVNIFVVDAGERSTARVWLHSRGHVVYRCRKTSARECLGRPSAHKPLLPPRVMGFWR